MRKAPFFLLFLLLIFFTACEEICGEVECANDPFLFTLSREDGMDLLNDPGSPFNPESLQFYFMEEGSKVHLEVMPQQNEDGRTIAFQTFLPNEEVSQYFFSTNISLSDTLTFEFEQDSDGCCPSKSIGQVFQNGQPLEKTNSGYSLSIPAPTEE